MQIIPLPIMTKIIFQQTRWMTSLWILFDLKSLSCPNLYCPFPQYCRGNDVCGLHFCFADASSANFLMTESMEGTYRSLRTGGRGKPGSFSSSPHSDMGNIFGSSWVSSMVPHLARVSLHGSFFCWIILVPGLL